MGAPKIIPNWTVLVLKPMVTWGSSILGTPHMHWYMVITSVHHCSTDFKKAVGSSRAELASSSLQWGLWHPHSAHQNAWLSSRRREVSWDSWTLHNFLRFWSLKMGNPNWLVGATKTPLENDGKLVSWDGDSIHNCFWKVIIHSCSSHHQPAIICPSPWSSPRRNFTSPWFWCKRILWNGEWTWARNDQSRSKQLSQFWPKKNHLENGGGGTLSIEKDQHPAF
jgi:hypothetical protein